jgi:hypothetical protein
MEGFIKTLKRGFGFIEESTTNRLWYFDFLDLTKLQMIREGFKVRFEKKANESCGDDETEARPVLEGDLRRRDVSRLLESVPEPEPIRFNPVLKAMPDARHATEKGED